MSPDTPPLAQDHVDTICDALGASTDVRTQAESLAVAADESAAINRAPTVTAAGAVYLASKRVGDHHSQAEIGVAADVSTLSVRAAYQELDALENSWDPDPATLRASEGTDRSAHARRNAEQLRRGREVLAGDGEE
jgi:hypothetical protein